MIKLLKRHWQWRLEKFYRRNRWHLILDLSLLIIIIILATAFASLKFYRPNISWLDNLSHSKTEIDLKNPPLKIVFSVPQPNLRLADGADLQINLANDGSLELQDVAIDLTAANQDFSLTKVTSPLENQALSINNRQLLIAKLPPKASLEIKVKVFFTAKNESAKIINWQAGSAYAYGGQTIKDAWALPDLKIKSELTAKALAYYSSPQGDQLGVGPLPPVVGVPTTYWLFFEASNNGDFKNFVMSGKLPSGVELTGQRSILAGEFKYNEATRQVVWQIKDMKADGGSYRAGFEVSFLPSLEQLGKLSPLLTSIKYYFQDAATDENQESQLSDLSTNLDFDKLNRGQGKVIKP